jgi:hypothetical protein
MKHFITLLAIIISTSAIGQIGDNGGATRDDQTTGIEQLDIRGSITTTVNGGQLTITSSNSMIELNQLHIHDINGKVVLSKSLTFSNSAINVSEFSSGIYILAIETSQGSVARKIFISGL